MRPTNETKITFDNLSHETFWYYDEEGISWKISRREYLAKTQVHRYKVEGQSVNINIEAQTIKEARDIVKNHWNRPQWAGKVFKALHDIHGVLEGLRSRGY